MARRRTALKSKRLRKARKKGFSWKKTRAARRIKRKIRILFFAVLSLFLTAGLLTGYSIYKFVKAPLVSASFGKVNRHAAWDGKRDINILFLILDDKDASPSYLREASIVRIDVENKKYHIFHLPVQTEFDLAERFGKGTLSKAFVLGNLEGKGITLVQRSLFKQLALHTSAYVLTDEKGLDDFERVLGRVNLDDIKGSVSASKIFLNLNFIRFLRADVRTNLSLGEILRLLSFIRSVDDANSTVSTIDEETFLNTSKFDNLWRRYIFSEKISKEGLRVLVLNGTSKPGLATWGGRVVENAGCILLDVGNAEKDYEESIVVTKYPGSQTAEKISSSFNISKLFDSKLYKDESFSFERGDVVVVLGLDFANIL